ncbi:MAG: hypothetical protein K2R93_10480 [Gemmatimonadaceae bacterium]|nr:hypothetical protein [Gemmatimonadaceae bacterium]
MTTPSHLAIGAGLLLAIGLTAPAASQAQAIKPAGLRGGAAAKPAPPTKDSVPPAPSLTPSKTALEAQPAPVVLPPKPTVGLSAAEKRRINRAMTRPAKAPAKAPTKPPMP